MGDVTGIQWTDHTFNGWWGCQRVSEACRYCYAEQFAAVRMGLPIWGGEKTERRFFGDKHWAEPLKWNRAAEKARVPARVFCSSMADVFEERADLDAPRARLFSLIESTPWLDWQLLTKRPHAIRGMLPAPWLTHPRPNVWLGTTVEAQKEADERIPHVLGVPAFVHFLSVEPLLGPLTLRGFRPDWAIIGGESGAHARPMDHDWLRTLLSERRAPTFVKQLGEHWARRQHPRGPEWSAHGGNPDLWEVDLRVREFPRSSARLTLEALQ